jgi:sialidase-1
MIKGVAFVFVKDTLLFASGGRSNYRIPSVVVTKNGTVAAFCNDRKDSLLDHAKEVAVVCAIKKAGGDWSEVRTLAGLPGWSCMIGSAVYDAETDTIMCSSGRNPMARHEFTKLTPEELEKVAKETEAQAKAMGVHNGPFLLYSSDNGETWAERPFAVEEVPFVRPVDGKEVMLGGSCHGSSHGIQLRHGDHAGRLLCPSRVAVDQYDTWEGLRTCSYNNSVYSDDHGLTWHATAPVQLGTGEGTLIECADGTILYNSRAYFEDGLRYLATSTDGGETWGEFRTDPFLREETNIGCNAAFLRIDREELGEDASLLPDGCSGITLFSNPRAPKRRNMTVCVSFDDGKTWAHTKQIWEGGAAYSSLAYSPVDRHIHLLYEKGRKKDPYQLGISVAEFDLAWLLDGDRAQ